MYAVTGITGKVGSIVARTLLGAGFPVRAVVRDADKGRAWAERGCEVAVASISDEAGLTKAFSGVDGVFLMTPPDFDPEPGFPKTHEAIAAVKTAIFAAKPAKVVFLSTIGAQVAEFNLLNNSKITEEGLRTVSVPVAFLRAAWFMVMQQMQAERDARIAELTETLAMINRLMQFEFGIGDKVVTLPHPPVAKPPAANSSLIDRLRSASA